MNLLFCINSGYADRLLDCLASIAAHGGAAHYEVYLLHSDLAQEVQHQLAAAAPACTSFHFIRVPPELFEGFPETSRYPHEIYYRLAAPLLLPDTLDLSLIHI